MNVRGAAELPIKKAIYFIFLNVVVDHALCYCIGMGSIEIVCVCVCRCVRLSFEMRL